MTGKALARYSDRAVNSYSLARLIRNRGTWVPWQSCRLISDFEISSAGKERQNDDKNLYADAQDFLL